MKRRRRTTVRLNASLVRIMETPSMLEAGKLMGWIAAEGVPKDALTVAPTGSGQWGLYVKRSHATRAAGAFKRVLKNVRRFKRNPCGCRNNRRARRNHCGCPTAVANRRRRKR